MMGVGECLIGGIGEECVDCVLLVKVLGVFLWGRLVWVNFPGGV